MQLHLPISSLPGSLPGRCRCSFLLLILSTLTFTFILSLLFLYIAHPRLPSSLWTFTPDHHPHLVTLSPPSWDWLHHWEQSLPQHNLSLPYPEGNSGRFLKFSNQNQRSGWNNVFHEILLNAHLAYESDRAYVFQSYLWIESHYPWPPQKMINRPPKTPLSALISGPTTGGPWHLPSTSPPRAIHESWFDIVCPPSERRLVSTGDLKHQTYWSEGIHIFQHWQSFLKHAPERCIEIIPEDLSKDSFPQVFDMWLLGSPRMLSLWDPFSKSPTARLLDASYVVKAAVEQNGYLFLSRSPRRRRRRRHRPSDDPFEHVLATHIRRGDFKDACTQRAHWKSTFYAWNLNPNLPDRFIDPPGGDPGENTPENIDVYLTHCLPSVDEIVHKVRQSRDEFYQNSTTTTSTTTTLDVIYLMTEEEGEWLDQIKSRLKEDGWYTVVTSRDLVLDEQQTEVGVAVDMEIARRAAVFVGNGWSSMTSSIVMKRLVDEQAYISCRFY